MSVEVGRIGYECLWKRVKLISTSEIEYMTVRIPPGADRNGLGGFHYHEIVLGDSLECQLGSFWPTNLATWMYPGTTVHITLYRVTVE